METTVEKDWEDAEYRLFSRKAMSLRFLDGMDGTRNII
jgi:hypothetical protein